MNILKEDFLLKDKSELLIDSPLRMIIWLLFDDFLDVVKIFMLF